MRRVLPLLALSCLAFAPAPKPRAKPRTDLEKMEGRWVMAECWSGGSRSEPDEGTPVTIEGARLTAFWKDGGQARFWWVLQQGPSRNGVGCLDMKECWRRGMGPAIYRLESDTLTICYGGKAGRPVRFEQGEVRLVLERRNP